MFWIASKLLDFWDWAVDSISVRWWMWTHRHRSKDELLRDAIEILENHPAGTLVHEAHEILTRVQREMTPAPEAEKDQQR